jgi:DNA polymerase-3 subunit epsilon
MIIFIDTETTGLPRAGNDFTIQPGIVEIAAIRYGDAPATQSWLINPEISAWDEGAIKTHGITPDQVIDCPTLYTVLPQLAAFMVGATAWGGYNVPFDQRVLWHQLMRYGMEMRFPWPPAVIDVMHMARDYLVTQGKRGHKFPKLIDAYELIIGKPLENAHSAMADIEATLALYEAMNDRS